MNWSVPRLWPGDTVVILGGGPSLNAGQVEHAKVFKRIATNHAYRLDPDAEVLCWGDYPWFQMNHRELANHKGALKITWGAPSGRLPFLPTYLDKVIKELDIRRLRRDTRSPLSMHPGLIAGSNTGHGALNLAVHLGAKRILLLGFDMTSVRGHNWHELHPLHASEHRFQKKWIPDFEKAATILKRIGVGVINCTPNSALTCFPFANIEDLVPVHA